jgi:hypothetical protein
VIINRQTLKAAWSFDMQLPQLRVRTLMIVVAIAGVYFALLHLALQRVAIAVYGGIYLSAVLGSLAERRAGGNGVLGGLAGGVVQPCLLLGSIYAFSEHRMLWGSGAISALLFIGACSGACVGLLVWRLSPPRRHHEPGRR